MLRYLVTYKIEGELKDPQIYTSNKIFNTMDMDDCYDVEVDRIYLISAANAPIECKFKGTWCCKDEDGRWDALRMEIVDKETGEVYSVGRGTDH